MVVVYRMISKLLKLTDNLWYRLQNIRASSKYTFFPTIYTVLNYPRTETHLEHFRQRVCQSHLFSCAMQIYTKMKHKKKGCVLFLRIYFHCAGKWIRLATFLAKLCQIFLCSFGYLNVQTIRWGKKYYYSIFNFSTINRFATINSIWILSFDLWKAKSNS